MTDASRFSNVTAVTELFPMTAAKPTYVQYNALTDIKGLVSADQTISIRVSSAKGSLEDPLRPDLFTEQAPFEVALLEFKSGATKVKITGDMRDLNTTPGTSNREAFVRVRAVFEYERSVEAALGPYANVDEVRITYDFNG